MPDEIRDFYNSLADDYHLIFPDWNVSIERQARVLSNILSSELPSHSPLRIFDCACGIGTQALGLAALGHRMVASDLSESAVLRARREAEIRDLKIEFHVSDMTSLAELTDRDFDAVIAIDNALPHLSSCDLKLALEAVGSRLRPGGLFLASTRDYDALIQQRPTMQQPMFHGGPGVQRIIHQVWEWTSETEYTLHLFITVQSGAEWATRHYLSHYRCLLRSELDDALASAGFREIRWRTPSQTGFYQPLVTARWP